MASLAVQWILHKDPTVWQDASRPPSKVLVIFLSNCDFGEVIIWQTNLHFLIISIVSRLADPVIVSSV
jgi:hypothetical protein